MEGNWHHWAEQVIQAAQVPLDDPRFLPHIHFILENDRQEGSLVEEILTRPHLRLSSHLELVGLQDSAAARSRLRARELATILIDEAGSLDEAALDAALDVLGGHSYSLGPNRHVDAARQAHLYRCLRWLKEELGLRRQLRAIDVPTGNSHGQQLMREALALPESVPVTTAHARRAVLSAWLTYLRQNVGSCFATAPAIMVQGEQPWRFLRDFEELLNTGQLTRTFGGRQYAVPLCTSWGLGDLLRPFPRISLDHLSQSPGLQAAFEAAGLLEAHLSEQGRLARTRSLLLKAAASIHATITNAETVIRLVLLAESKLNESDLEEYRLRAESVPRMALMMGQASVGGLAARVAVFEKKLEMAQAAFKSVTENALLKTWEFTVASFADVKASFSKWNLYVSLGFDPKEPGGIGETIARLLQERIDRINRELEELNARYEIAFSAVRMVEGRLQRASEEQMRWLRVEYSQKMGDLNAIQAERQAAATKGNRMGGLLKRLVEAYEQLFPDYFQEVYDPSMHDVVVGPFDDSPAGFRLLYKHGRANPSLWTLIYTPDQFVQALIDFLVATEGALQADAEFLDIREEIGALVTDIIAHVRTREFLESAFARASVRHKGVPIADPLKNLERMGAKPWSYVSGGTMTTLASAYFSREEGPTLAQRVVESPFDLLVFLIDTLKGLPASDTRLFLEDPLASMLIQSPTHGFLLKPGFSPFCKAWMDRGNTSTWIRRWFIRPGQAMVETLMLDEGAMRSLANSFGNQLAPQLQLSLREALRRLPAGRASVRDFRQFILEQVSSLPWIAQGPAYFVPAAQIDSLLFSQIPFTAPKDLAAGLIAVLEELLAEDPPLLDRARAALELSLRRRGLTSATSCAQFQQMIQALLALALGSTTSDRDLPWEVRAVMRRQGRALPAPLLVADTNWNNEFFSFVVNPGTGELDFWRVDYLGLSGSPMHEWRPWLQGKQTQPWALYIRASEYTAPP
jgi:hypothetical protein